MMLARVALNTTGLGPRVTVTCLWRAEEGRRWVQRSDMNSRAWLCCQSPPYTPHVHLKKEPQPYCSYIAVKRLPWWLRWCRIYLQCRRRGFSPWIGKIPWRTAWQPTQYSCLENSTDRGAWRARGFFPRGRKELDTTE